MWACTKLDFVQACVNKVEWAMSRLHDDYVLFCFFLCKKHIMPDFVATNDVYQNAVVAEKIWILQHSVNYY